MGSTRGGDPLRVVVGLPTFCRPEALRRILPLLVHEVEGLRGATASLVVVDNDPDGSARDVVAPFGGDGVRYVHEPRPGISAARNRAIAEAEGADAIAFIDDDEVPQPGWLQALTDGWRQWGCAAVTGPVAFIFEGPADVWVRASGVFERKIRVTGAENPGASSANLLLDLRTLDRLGIRFDERFGLSGGSDTMLAHTLKSRSERIRWCQEAEVSEYVPAERSTRAWVFRRTMRTSNTYGRVKIALAAGSAKRGRVRAEITARALVRIVRGAASRLVGRLRGDDARDARGAMDVASGLGLLMSVVDVVRYEYQRSAAPSA
jgi:succinoglycan biosynthesis protein ExoM